MINADSMAFDHNPLDLHNMDLDFLVDNSVALADPYILILQAEGGHRGNDHKEVEEGDEDNWNVELTRADSNRRVVGHSLDDKVGEHEEEIEWDRKEDDLVEDTERKEEGTGQRKEEEEEEIGAVRV